MKKQAPWRLVENVKNTGDFAMQLV